MIPPISDLQRRWRADGDFRFFCETYFPQVFSLAWSEDHLRVIAKIERAASDVSMDQLVRALTAAGGRIVVKSAKSKPAKGKQAKGKKRMKMCITSCEELIVVCSPRGQRVGILSYWR